MDLLDQIIINCDSQAAILALDSHIIKTNTTATVAKALNNLERLHIFSSFATGRVAALLFFLSIGYSTWSTTRSPPL